MPVRIRLSLHGCRNRPFYHIVVAPSKFKRDGRHLEQVDNKIISTIHNIRKLIIILVAQLGCYDPMPNKKGEIVVGLNAERMK